MHAQVYILILYLKSQLRNLLKSSTSKQSLPLLWAQASNSLYFKPSQLLRVSYRETSAVIHFDVLLFRKYH